MLIKLLYSYDGSKFLGSQSQPHLQSVEDALKMALGHVGIYEPLTTSSRTDKGVHALGQVSSVRCGEFWDLARLRVLINRHLNPSVYIKRVEKMPENFHPRFSAKKRAYRYVLNHSEYSPFLAPYCYFYGEVDLKRLNEILAKFVGEHDFSEFMKSGSEIKSSVRKISDAYAFSYKNLTIIKFRADGFLRAQVRLMVANALKELSSKGEFKIQKAITRIPAPPNGLYLERIFY